MPLKDYSVRDKYTYPDSPVLINRKNIRDGERLEQFESEAVYLRSAQLLLRPIAGRFDIHHLKAVHHYLFQDVYAWADELRTVNISKGSSTFGFWQYIEQHLTSELERISREQFLAGLQRAQLVQRLTYFLSEINAAHPFREGNGRAQREFIRELALRAGHKVNWSTVNRDALYTASADSMKGNLAPLAEIIDLAMD